MGHMISYHPDTGFKLTVDDDGGSAAGIMQDEAPAPKATLPKATPLGSAVGLMSGAPSDNTGTTPEAQASQRQPTDAGRGRLGPSIMSDPEQPTVSAGNGTGGGTASYTGPDGRTISVTGDQIASSREGAPSDEYQQKVRQIRQNIMSANTPTPVVTGAPRLDTSLDNSSGVYHPTYPADEDTKHRVMMAESDYLRDMPYKQAHEKAMGEFTQKAPAEAPMGGTVSFGDGEPAQGVNHYLNKNEEANAQARANATNRIQWLPGTGGNIARWISPSKSETVSEGPTGGVSAQDSAKYDTLKKQFDPFQQKMSAIDEEISSLTKQLGTAADSEKPHIQERIDAAKARQAEIEKQGTATVGEEGRQWMKDYEAGKFTGGPATARSRLKTDNPDYTPPVAISPFSPGMDSTHPFVQRKISDIFTGKKSDDTAMTPRQAWNGIKNGTEIERASDALEKIGYAKGSDQHNRGMEGAYARKIDSISGIDIPAQTATDAKGHRVTDNPQAIIAAIKAQAANGTISNKDAWEHISSFVDSRVRDAYTPGQLARQKQANLENKAGKVAKPATNKQHYEATVTANGLIYGLKDDKSKTVFERPYDDPDVIAAAKGDPNIPNSGGRKADVLRERHQEFIDRHPGMEREWETAIAAKGNPEIKEQWRIAKQEISDAKKAQSPGIDANGNEVVRQVAPPVVTPAQLDQQIAGIRDNLQSGMNWDKDIKPGITSEFWNSLSPEQRATLKQLRDQYRSR